MILIRKRWYKRAIWTGLSAMRYRKGISPVTAIQMATINTADYFGVSREMGMIAPGRYGDVLLVKDLNNFYADTVISKGRVVAENGKMLLELHNRKLSGMGTDVSPFTSAAGSRAISDW